MSAIKEVEIKVLPSKIEDWAFIESASLQKAGIIYARDFVKVKMLKKSIDSRGKQPFYLCRMAIYEKGELPEYRAHHLKYQSVKDKQRVIIIGAGPAGYWAALELIELGIKPIVIDRGKDVQARRRDLRAIQQFGEVNPHSNYCFGEGGAGTYSDGKLYTRSHKRGSIQKVLEQFVDHGASEEILVDAHPHIGSNKLPTIISNIRNTILDLGGEIHFNTYITDFKIESNHIKGIFTERGDLIEGEAYILATGHSARDMYRLLNNKNILIEPKPFALGVRIEHSQNLIDELQYHQNPREENLPAASYKAVCQINNIGVFSFCMCPGGLIVPASTSPGEIVVNGMSLSRRDSPYANSGFVTSIELKELYEHGYKGIFASLDFQSEVEQNMFHVGNGTQAAPAQRVADFVNKKISADLPPTSYIPGIHSQPLHSILPSFVASRLQKGIMEINKKMKGFYSNDAIIVGTESRTSAPIKIPRIAETMMHPQIVGLFPCGEGAGYAGGILSAAMDGQNVAKAVDKFLKK